MRSDRIKLAEWIGDVTDSYVDIPWPLVHKQAGSEIISWLTKQDHIQCQMILDKKKDSAIQSLWAEFYDANLRAECDLKFGK